LSTAPPGRRLVARGSCGCESAGSGVGQTHPTPRKPLTPMDERVPAKAGHCFFWRTTARMAASSAGSKGRRPGGALVPSRLSMRARAHRRIPSHARSSTFTRAVSCRVHIKAFARPARTSETSFPARIVHGASAPTRRNKQRHSPRKRRAPRGNRLGARTLGGAGISARGQLGDT